LKKNIYYNSLINIWNITYIWFRITLLNNWLFLFFFIWLTIVISHNRLQLIISNNWAMHHFFFISVCFINIHLLSLIPFFCQMLVPIIFQPTNFLFFLWSPLNLLSGNISLVQRCSIDFIFIRRILSLKLVKSSTII